MAKVTATAALPQGASKLTMRFLPLGPGKGAEVVLSAGGAELARVTTPHAMLMPAGGGETFDVGRDIGVTVTDYATPHGAIEGDVPHVSVTLLIDRHDFHPGRHVRHGIGALLSRGSAGAPGAGRCVPDRRKRR